MNILAREFYWYFFQHFFLWLRKRVFAGRTQNRVPESPARTEGLEIHWIIKTGETHFETDQLWKRRKHHCHDHVMMKCARWAVFNFTTVTSVPRVESMTMQ